MKKPIFIGLLFALMTGSFACGEEIPGKPSMLGWVKVVDGRLMDEAGREILLRGINARIEGIFDVVFSDKEFEVAYPNTSSAKHKYKVLYSKFPTRINKC